MVERQIVDLVVEGSNPSRHPLLQDTVIEADTCRDAFVAQLDRAADFESAGRTFEPCRTQNFQVTNTGD